MNGTDSKSREQSRKRKLLIKALTLTFPLLLLLLIEGGLRLISYGDNLKLFIPNPRDGYEAIHDGKSHSGKEIFPEFSHMIALPTIYS